MGSMFDMLFICGRSSGFSARLRATANISSTDLHTWAEQARIYLADKQFHNASVSAMEKARDQNRSIGEIHRKLKQSTDDAECTEIKKNWRKIKCLKKTAAATI